MILVLLWFLLDYKSMTNVIFLFVVFIILLRTTYQLDYFEHGKWNINIENDGKILNLTEIIGLQKWSNAFMFVKSTSNMILIIFIMVVRKIIEVHLKFKYYPEKIPSVVFYHISAQQMNDGLLEWLMCIINEGFTYFGVEITLMWVVILVATNIDGFSIIYVLWIAIFAYLGYEKSSKYWSIFVAFVYFTIVFKYLLLFKTLIDIKFDENLLNKIGPLSNILSIISVLDHKSIIKRLCGLDFVVYYFVSQQSLIFKTKNKPINELIDTKSEELPDNLMTKRENFNVLKQNILYIYANFVMLVVFLNGVCYPDKIALGYLYTSYLFFSKGPKFYLQLYSNIINFFDDFDNNVNKHRHWFIQFIVALRDAIISCSDLLCYFAAFIYTTVNLYDYISITLLVVMIFWGLLSVPRESKNFWVVLIMYMQGAILLKHFCNISYLPWIEEQSRLVNGSMGGNLMFYPTIKIGVANYKNTFYVDLIVLLFLYIHRAKLMKIGLWIQNDNLTNIRIKISPLDENRLLKSIRLFCEIIKIHFSPMINFSNDLYRNHMVKSVDVYPYMFLLIVFLMIFNLIIWHDAVESVKLSRISSKIIYEIIVHFIMLLLDRWFYVRQNKLGKLIFHMIFTTNFFYVLIELADMFEYNYFVLWATIEFVYIMLSAYQIRAGYSSRNIGSFIWHHYSILNLIIFKVYYYCPFVYELRLVFDWIWTDSTLTMSEWFKMEDIFVHICTVKCINRLRFLLDNPRGKKISRMTKIVFGGLVAIIILSVIIFPILWFSLPEGIPDTPKHVTMHIRFYRDTTILTTKSADIYSLDTLDFAALKEVYKNQLSHFLDGYRYNEISSVSIKLESSTAWFVTPHTFNTVLNKLQDSKKVMKLFVEWFISHENGLTISHGSNTIPLFWDVRQEILECISRSINHTKKQNYNDLCKGVYIKHVLPKFLVTHLKSTEAKVIPKFMQHDQENPYMDVILKFLCDKDAKKSYWWGLSEVCPESDKGNYLKEIPHSSCIRNETKSSRGFNSYNIYIFSDRRSNLFGNFDSEGVFGLYTAVIVYFGFKVAHDLFRSFKFKLIYTEMPYPDRILQLCQEIYLVRSFGEWEMEEDLYAMLIYLFKSPETLLKFTKMPN
ncbi:piezo-type mechanosensitive ion channel component-like [Daktulosphaira vitifoliae]|uniref:piezo-type mechanosensitive ion channel component-like n=1 Tax=Daktulosphaira vitifoliae TaxID=58002 RepID=UPI0021AA5E4F|nr:piezo-type mechanosensitive ion channel component-like [Daktulosphaira vitifoliae]